MNKKIAIWGVIFIVLAMNVVSIRLESPVLDETDLHVYFVNRTTNDSIQNNVLSDIGALVFNTSPHEYVHREGTLYWDETHKTIAMYNDEADVTLQIGMENWIRVRNTDSVTIKNGQLAYISGATGHTPDVKLAIANETMRAKVSGMATHDIEPNTFGYITTFGEIHDLNTNGCLQNQTLFLSETEYGNFTCTAPTNPNYIVRIGIIELAHATQGSLFLDIGLDYTNGVTFNSLNLLYNFTLNSTTIQDLNELVNTLADDFVNITGDTMQGPLSMGGYNLTNINSLVAPDGSFISFGSFENLTNMNKSITTFNNQSLPAGGIVYSVGSNGAAGPTIHLMLQKGRNNSAGIWGNSLAIMPNTLPQTFSTDALNITDCLKLCDFFNKTCRLACDTGGYGASLMVQGGVHVWRELFVDEGITARGGSSFITNGNDLDIIGDMHVRTIRYELIGTNTGEETTPLLENFDDGDISPFTQTTTGGGGNEWNTDATENCHFDICARAGGVVGASPVIMDVNISTINSTSLNLSFYLTTLQLDAAADYFNVSINNNSGSGFIELYSIYDGTDVDDVLVEANIPVNMENISAVTLRYEFAANNPSNEYAYVDNVVVHGIATADTTENLTRFDSWIYLGVGEGLEYIYYNDSNRKITFSPGNVTFSSIEQSELNVTDSITLNSTTIKDWEDISKELSEYFVNLTGDKWQGNMDVNSYNLTKVGCINFTDGSLLCNATGIAQAADPVFKAVVSFYNNSEWNEDIYNNDTITRQFELNNTGNYNATDCTITSYSVLDTYLETEAVFNITNGEAKTLDINISTPALGNYNTQLFANCKVNSTGFIEDSINSVQVVLDVTRHTANIDVTFPDNVTLSAYVNESASVDIEVQNNGTENATSCLLDTKNAFDNYFTYDSFNIDAGVRRNITLTVGYVPEGSYFENIFVRCRLFPLDSLQYSDTSTELNYTSIGYPQYAASISFNDTLQWSILQYDNDTATTTFKLNNSGNYDADDCNLTTRNSFDSYFQYEQQFSVARDTEYEFELNMSGVPAGQYNELLEATCVINSSGYRGYSTNGVPLSLNISEYPVPVANITILNSTAWSQNMYDNESVTTNITIENRGQVAATGCDFVTNTGLLQAFIEADSTFSLTAGTNTTFEINITNPLAGTYNEYLFVRCTDLDSTNQKQLIFDVTSTQVGEPDILYYGDFDDGTAQGWSCEADACSVYGGYATSLPNSYKFSKTSSTSYPLKGINLDIGAINLQNYSKIKLTISKQGLPYGSGGFNIFVCTKDTGSKCSFGYGEKFWERVIYDGYNYDRELITINFAEMRNYDFGPDDVDWQNMSYIAINFYGAQPYDGYIDDVRIEK